MSFAANQRVRRKKSEAPAPIETERPQRAVPSPYFGSKDSIGRCLALVLFVAGLPLMAAAMLVVRLTSPGPALFRQIRVGKNGRTFMMYKIRTMRVDAELRTGPVWTQRRDPRITRVGRVLRKLHLDEFPQLVNVLRGEMALIGPRPERPEFTQHLALAIRGYLHRLAVRPGITGLAQINLPPDTDTDSVRRKLVLDLVYVREGGVALDLKIFACTFARLFGIKGRLVTRCFGLDYAGRLLQPASPPDVVRLVGALNGSLDLTGAKAYENGGAVLGALLESAAASTSLARDCRAAGADLGESRAIEDDDEPWPGRPARPR